jgi:SAM-dependent methyltransferase
MSNAVGLEDFIRYAETYTPFPWEISDDDRFQAADIKGKHSVLVNLVRFWKIVNALRETVPSFGTVVDVGPFPGAMIKILRHYFPQDFKYWAVGLGLSESYCRAMEDLGGSCFETELDPEFVEPEPVRTWPMRDVDCVLLLDVIEHLTNPTHCLDAINRAMRAGGVLVLTTDNLTSFANVYQMARRGHSPNIHPVRSSQFYRGEWRPHFREFSADELRFFLEYSGFSVKRHEYFERKQGDYFLDSDGHVLDRHRQRGIKGLIQKAILCVGGHLMDHQIVVATKVAEADDVSVRRPVPTRSKAEWMEMRARLGL